MTVAAQLNVQLIQLNLNLTQMNADNRLSICQQTNTLQNAITSGFNTLSSENATRFNILGAKIDAQTQMINDKFCQLEMREKCRIRSTHYVTKRMHCNLLHCYNNRLLISLVKLDLVRFLLT